MAYLISQYPAVNHTYILREIRELRKSGWDIEVASIRPDTRPASQLTAEEREESAHTRYVTMQGFYGALRAHLIALVMQPRSYIRGMLSALELGGADIRKAVWNFFYFTEALIVGQWMGERGLNHVHIHYASTVGLLIAKTYPVTISITIHGSAEFENPTSFHLREKIEASSFVCAISDYGRTQLMKACGSDQWDKIETVRLGIDPSLFVPRSAPAGRRDSFNVTSVGNLTHAKGHRILIEAVTQLVGKGRRVHLRLVGEGPDRSTLESRISDCGLFDTVSLEGTLNQDQLRALYRESDAFALASLAEGVPVVLMEAMAMEIPCVATRITGIPELIENEINGLLVEPSNAGQLAAAIAELMDNPDLYRRIATAGRRKIIEEYNLSKNVALLAKLFNNRANLLPTR
jgi:colanic acid/amylovoran biosynthesis glycosyltransferase